MSAWVVVPVEPTDKLLLSMAIRFDHGLGLPGYYDQELFGKKLGGDISHARRLEVALSQMRQLHEEVVGAGFYKAARPTGPDVPVLLVPRTEAEWQREFEKWYGTREEKWQVIDWWNARWDAYCAALRLVGAIKENGT